LESLPSPSSNKSPLPSNNPLSTFMSLKTNLNSDCEKKHPKFVFLHLVYFA
jgi:hypothetical protein